MTGAPALHPEDGPAFERVLRQALNTPEIRAALRRHGSAGGPAAERLRTRALAERAGIATAAAPEYAAYLRQRTTVASCVRAGRAGGAPSAGASAGASAEASAAVGVRGLLSALAVLAPVLAAAATAVFLLLGYVLGLSGPGTELGDALLAAGHTAAVVTAVTTAGGVTWLLITAARHRTPAADPAGDTPEAREVWQRALLERGILPFLRDQLRQAQPDRAAAPRRRPGPGYSSPDFASPEYTRPGFTVPPASSED